MVQLDDTDRRILAILQADNQISNLELAARLGISSPTCLRRVRRLREEKVIVADVALVDPLVVGRALFVFIEVMFERQSEVVQHAFETRMAEIPEVTQCYMVSGDTDFLLVVQIADMKAFHAFVRRELTNDPDIRNFRSHFALNRTKFRTSIDLR